MGKEKRSTIGVIENQRIRHKGIYNFNGILKAIPSWFSSHKYDFIKKGHGEKKGSTGGYLEASWVASREITDYVKYTIKIDIWMRDMQDIAMEKEGKTTKMNKGNIEITFNGSMEKDYNKTFTNKKGKQTEFLRFIKEMYEKYVIKGKLGDYEDKLYIEVQDLVDKVKSNMLK